MKKYRADWCSRDCGCEDCPGAEGFDTFMEMAQHEHIVCIHQAAELDRIMREGTGPKRPLRKVPLAANQDDILYGPLELEEAEPELLLHRPYLLVGWMEGHEPKEIPDTDRTNE